MLGVSGNVIASPRERERPNTPDLNSNNTNHEQKSSPKIGLPSIDDIPKPTVKKLEYNPYGINTGLTVSQRLNNSEIAISNEDVNILPYPLEDPNDHLPDEFKQINTDLFKEYELINDSNLIGTGASASVRKIHKIHKPKEIYALKKFVLFKNEKPNEFYERSVKEYIIHKNLSNGIHIVKCVSLIKIPHQQNLTRAWGFILEYCKMDLFSLVSKKGWRFSPLQEKLCIFKQLIYGVKFIHECDIVHRDLKPENILLTFNGVVKITDFGVSDYGHNIPGDFSSGIKNCINMVGSPPYTPPEVCSLQGIPQQMRTSYNPFKMDLWASGMILFVIFYMNTPFTEANSKRCQQYREYEHGYGNYMTKNPHFRKNDYSRGGPGVDYKFAREFPNNSIARLAWRLCDPMASTRYNLFDIFNDPAFQEIEMCIDENEYECNFYHHNEHKNHTDDFKGKVEYGSNLEILATPSSSSSSIYNNKFSRQSSFSSLYSNNYSRKPTLNNDISFNSNLNSNSTSTPPPSQTKVKSMLGVVADDVPSHNTIETIKKNNTPSSVDSNSIMKTNNIGIIPKPSVRSIHSNSAPSTYIPTTTTTTSSRNGSIDSVNHTSDTNHSNTDALATLKEDEVVDENGFVDAVSSLPNGTTKPSITSLPSTASLDCLCTSDGLKPIKLGSSNTIEVIPVDIIKKCGCCRIKPHHHFEIVDAYR